MKKPNFIPSVPKAHEGAKKQTKAPEKPAQPRGQVAPQEKLAPMKGEEKLEQKDATPKKDARKNIKKSQHSLLSVLIAVLIWPFRAAWRAVNYLAPLWGWRKISLAIGLFVCIFIIALLGAYSAAFFSQDNFIARQKHKETTQKLVLLEQNHQAYSDQIYTLSQRLSSLETQSRASQSRLRQEIESLYQSQNITRAPQSSSLNALSPLMVVQLQANFPRSHLQTIVGESQTITSPPRAITRKWPEKAMLNLLSKHMKIGRSQAGERRSAGQLMAQKQALFAASEQAVQSGDMGRALVYLTQLERLDPNIGIVVQNWLALIRRETVSSPATPSEAVLQAPVQEKMDDFSKQNMPEEIKGDVVVDVLTDDASNSAVSNGEDNLVDENGEANVDKALGALPNATTNSPISTEGSSL